MHAGTAGHSALTPPYPSIYHQGLEKRSEWEGSASTAGCLVSNSAAQPSTSSAATPAPFPIKMPATPESADALKARIADLQEELVACQRLALLGNLAAMAAHEFNNLMTPIIARVEAALTSGDVPFMRKALERSLVQAQRAITLSRHLLDRAHNDGQDLGVCSAAGAVREAVETATRPFEKDGIELRVAVPDDLQVGAREELLCQVLLNLLLNARQAMKGLSGPLSITAAASGDHVEIDVQDSGKGLPPEMSVARLNAFLAAEPSQNPNDWQQIGLGLSVCRLIARRHGATIQVSANADRGCTFRLCWPLAKPGSRSGEC